MSRPLHLLQDGALDGPTNMGRDEHLLHDDRLRPAVLRLYAWSPPTISLGYFQRYADVAHLPEDVRELAVVRRSTGGGAILHDAEVTYCLVVDATMPITKAAPVALYELVHTCWRDTVAEDGVSCGLAPEHFPMPTPRTGPFFCFEKPGRTDLIIGEQKLLGSAQRRLPDRVLQHGSLLLGRRFATHPGADLGNPEPAQVARWKDRFAERVAAALELTPQPAAWTADQLADAARRAEKYASATWNEQR